MDYIILESNGATNAFSFQAEVTAKIEEGYKPVGGLSVIPNDLFGKYDDGVKFYQAMCREGNKYNKEIDGIVCQECFTMEATMQSDDDGTYLCSRCWGKQ
jgi:hypothetical protein